MSGSCERGDEPPVCIKYGEFLDCLRRYQLVKEVCAAWSRLVLLLPRGPRTGKAAIPRGPRALYSKAETDGYFEKLL